MKPKSNITLKLDTAILRQAKILAAERGTSVSALLTDRLVELVGSQKRYSKARTRALQRLRKGFDLGWTPPRSRDELHER